MPENDLSASFIIDRIPRQVWEQSHTILTPQKTCRIPVLPDYEDNLGSKGTIIESDPERLLVALKDSEPFPGTEISIRLEPINASGWPTQVTITQNQTDSSSDLRESTNRFLWKEFLLNYQLYLERNIICPPYKRLSTLGLSFDETPLGLVVTRVAQKTFAANCGIQIQDLLISIQGERVLNARQFFTLVSFLDSEESVQIQFARGNKTIVAKSKPL